MKIVITESQLNTILKEHYDPEKLYHRDSVIARLMKGPRELRKYAKSLPEIGCVDGQGNQTICTKVPEVIYIYLSGKY